MYKLTDEQIEEIISDYGQDKAYIEEVERELNMSGMVENEEDYERLVIECVDASHEEFVEPSELEIEYKKAITTEEDLQFYNRSIGEIVETKLEEYENEKRKNDFYGRTK